MAKNKKKKKKYTETPYEVGYCKPPKEYQWVKGCKSPNPKGRPKKITSLKEAMKVNLGREITIRNEDGEEQKISYADALSRKTIKDAITKDGPTRRMLYRNDLLNLEAKEPEYEYEETEKDINAVQKVEEKYGQLLHDWASVPEKIRDMYSRMISQALVEYANEKTRKEN